MSEPYDITSHLHIHLDNLQELRTWDPNTIPLDAVNVSNVPLQPRSQVEKGAGTLPKVLVCHDFKGSYLPYEAAQGILTSDVVYTMEYLQLVDMFVYFSHKRVSIPPASFINLMHRNGIRCLGTFLVEPGNTSASGLDELLERDLSGQHVFAEKLAAISKHYGFDGWLLNFEARFPDLRYSLKGVLSFVESLKLATRRGNAGGEVIWYDSLTILNRVFYQNGINWLNRPFFDVATAFFANYHWKPNNQLTSTAEYSKSLQRNADVYMGIDCYGRGTYGGGGFSVGTALAAIQHAQVSAAIFAPGWTYEHYGGLHFHARERKFWMSSDAIDAELVNEPVSKFAPLHAAGSSTYFYSNFNRGYGKNWWFQGKPVSSKPTAWAHIGVQSLLPTYYPSRLDPFEWKFDDSMAYTGGQSLLFKTSGDNFEDGEMLYCKLFKLGMTYTKGLSISFTFMMKAHLENRVSIYYDVMLGSTGGTERYEIIVPASPSDIWATEHHKLELDDAEAAADNDLVLVELGVAFFPLQSDQTADRERGEEAQNGRNVLHLGEIVLGSIPRVELPLLSKISKQTIEVNTLLSWSMSKTKHQDQGKANLWSAITGSFAYFVVWKGLGEWVGVSHCLTFVVPGTVEEGAVYRVSGLTWDGRVVHGPWW